MLAHLLGDVLATPLPVGTSGPLRLASVPRAAARRLEFHLPVHSLDAAALMQLLGELDSPRRDWTSRRCGYRGYIDLIVEHDGCHFVVDWSPTTSATTPRTTAPTLAAAMAGTATTCRR